MSQTPASTPRETGRIRAVLSAVGKLLIKDWKTKVLALVLAIALWAGLITQDPTLTREKHFDDVKVTVSGSDTLKRNGYIVTSDLDEVLGDVSLTVDVPQMQYAAAQASNYNVRLDLSRITAAGEQDVRILTTNTSTYGTVQSVEPDMVRVQVDEYITRYRIPVSVVTTGSIDEDYYATEPSIDPPMLAVSGPASLVNAIESAMVTVDLGALPQREGTVRKAVPYALLDVNGKVIKSDLLQVTSESVLVDSIVVSQQLYARRVIGMSEVGLLRGTPAEGYEIKHFTITPSQIVIAGSKELLDTIDLLYANTYVDVSGLSGSFNQTIRLRQPANLAYISASEVNVTVELGPVTGNMLIEDLGVEVRSLAEGLTAVPDETTATVSVSGPQLWLDMLSEDHFTVYVDATGLGEGTHELPLLCEVRDAEYVTYTLDIQPVTALVTIGAQ